MAGSRSRWLGLKALRKSRLQSATNSPSTPPITASSKRDVVIAIDAGHGGEDPGAIGPDGLKEKNVTLAVARDVAKAIDAHPGTHAFLTRKADYYAPLWERVRLAVQAHADLFISIHANSAHDRYVKGGSVYMLSEKKASDRVAQILADKENAADAIGGVMPDEVKDPVVNEILVDLKKRESLNSAQMLAKDILHDLSKVEPVKYKNAKRARFMVLTEPRMPSVLVELDFISNPRRERLLAQPGHRQQLAEALSRASLTFLHQEERLASAPRPVPVNTRKAQNAQKECAKTAVARLKTVAIHSAPSSVTLRPYRSENFPCASEPNMNPISPLETSSPAWLGSRCHGFMT